MARVATDDSAPSRSRTIHSRLAAGLRAVALLPLIALPLMFLLQKVAEYSGQPIGVLFLAAWSGAVLLWLIVELLRGGNVQFGLARLLVVTVLFGVVFAGGRAYVLSPIMEEAAVLRSIEGLSSVHRKSFGPAWMRWLLSDKYFERVYLLEIEARAGGGAEIPKLRALQHLQTIFLTGPGFTDEGLAAVTAVPDTATVNFTSTRVTEEGLARLRALRPHMNLQRQGLSPDDQLFGVMPRPYQSGADQTQAR